MIVGLFFWGVDFSAPPNPVGGCPEVFSPATGCSEGTAPWARGAQGLCHGDTRPAPQPGASPRCAGFLRPLRAFTVAKVFGVALWPVLQAADVGHGQGVERGLEALATAVVVTPGLSPGAFRGPEVLPMAFAGVFAVALRCLRW